MTRSAAFLAQEHLSQGRYAEAVLNYEQAIEATPTNADLYWNYGIALLLNGQENDAQSIWMSILLEADSEETQRALTEELVQDLTEAVMQCQSQDRPEEAWILRRYQCEFSPQDALLVRDTILVGLQVELIALDDALIEHLNSLATESESLFSEANIQETCKLLHILLDINPEHPTVQNLALICMNRTLGTPQAKNTAEVFRDVAWNLKKRSCSRPATLLVRYGIELDPENVGLLEESLDILTADLEARQQAVQIAERLVTLAANSVARLRAMDALTVKLMRMGGQMERVQALYPNYKALFYWLAKAVEPLAAVDPIGEPEKVLSYVQELGDLRALLSGGFSCLYFEDEPKSFRRARNQIAMAAQAQGQVIQTSNVERFRESNQTTERRCINRPLRIGYLADTFRQHSVGWLCRWLLKHHDRERFDVHLYTSTTQANDFVQQSLLRDYGDRFHIVQGYAEVIANEIFEDEIDILVELDSMTDPTTLLAVASKPAPVQVSWLGFDASGLPAIDYFIADPYVLPKDADTYYQEKIWRLPQTYIAVDGFESYTPTLRRDQLDIPTDAVVYLTSQAGFKRNPHNVKQQMRILKEVSNGYLLIKSFSSDPESLQAFFFELAEEVGVPADRLRFLPDFPSEFTYRANLNLADVVLDTYPYNGATTTLEALWMGLPIVTRVGEQFAARNSYTMMVNAGITEGIAWSDDEYVEWGIRLGQDEALRRDVVWKLHQSRHTAPLWNTKQFAREMENAYEQMWQQWCDRPTS